MVPDNEDDQPTEPGVSSGYIEDALRGLADLIAGLDVPSFEGHNDNAREGRQGALTNKLQAAAAAIAAGDLQAALDTIQNDLLPKLDGEPGPGDWMENGEDKSMLYDELELLASLIALALGG